jgi:hypothetical protein
MTESAAPESLPDQHQDPASSGPQGDPLWSAGQEPKTGSDQPSAPSGHDSSGPSSSISIFPLLLVLFLAFRLLTLFLLRPGGFVRDWSDFDTYLGIAAISDYGLYPFLHYWLEWPPLVPWLAVAAYKLSLFFPPWTDHRLWFTLILGSVFVLFETGNLVLIYRIARLLNGRRPAVEGSVVNSSGQESDNSHGSEVGRTQFAARSVVLYALLFVPIYAMLGFFDAIALFFLLFALDCILRGRLLSSAVSVGVGFLVKLTPIIFVPVALRQLWIEAEDQGEGLRDGALYLVTTLLTILVLLLPFLLTQPVWLWTMVRAVAGRSSWETVWALVDGYFGYGVVGGDRLNPAETAFAVHASSLPWWLITVIFGLIYLLLWTYSTVNRSPQRSHSPRGPRDVVALTGLTVTLFLLYSKGYSPQFLVYLLPFVILLFPDIRGVTYSLLLTLLNVLEQPVYFVLIPDTTWLLKGIILARWLVFGALLVEFSSVLWQPSARWWAFLRRYAPVGLSVLIGLGLIVATPALGRAYAEGRLTEDPAASLIGYLGTEQAQAETDVLLVTDQELLRRVMPYLSNDYDLRLLGGDRLYRAAPTVVDLVADSEKVWVVTEPGAPARQTAEILDGQGRSLVIYNFEEGITLQLFAPERRGSGGVATPSSPVARLAGGAVLIGHALERPARDQLSVTLYWWAVDTPVQSYVVFTQVLDDAGDFVAGHDGPPVNGAAPTESWVPGRVYADTHLIQLPRDLPSGVYSLVTGMYDSNFNRLLAAGLDAMIFPDGMVPLGEIELP